MSRHVDHKPVSAAIVDDPDIGAEHPAFTPVVRGDAKFLLVQPISGAHPFQRDAACNAGWQQRGDRQPAQHVDGCDAQHSRKRRIAFDDDGARSDLVCLLVQGKIGGNRGIELGTEDCLRRDRDIGSIALLAVLERCAKAPLTVVGQRPCHHVGHRGRERLLVEQPLAHRSDVLVADDTGQRARVGSHGRLEHRRDAERPEVVVGELARSWIALRIRCVDRARFFERGDVLRKYADVDLAAGHVPAEAASIEAAADEPLTVGREQPDAGSLDVDRDAGGFRDARERVVDAGIRITAMRGEREQRALLPPQSAARL
jgi:hypothetical protein